MPSGMVADAHNLGYVHELHERYLTDAESVPAEWQAYFASSGEELAAALGGPMPPSHPAPSSRR